VDRVRIVAPEVVREVLGTVSALCQGHEISALEDFIDSIHSFAREEMLNVAVLGRFKAGKSSFINHVLGRSVLPVGAVPVTSVVTEIEWGPSERAEIAFADGRSIQVPVGRVEEFISENQNPENCKQVARVLLALPSMARYRGVRFVDTPGLESVLQHNTEASLEWLPNVGLALVAVGVDPPLSQHDIELIRKLSRYTPHISLLLTKVDVLDETERVQVHEFVRKQLSRYLSDSVPVFLYSVRPGFEHLRRGLETALLKRVRADAGEQHAAILLHKLDSLLRECSEYLNVALKSAEVADADREALRIEILGETESLADARLALQLIVRHAAGSIRTTIEALLHSDELAVRDRLQRDLNNQFPSWARSLSVATEKFEDWLRDVLTGEMAELSRQHRDRFTEPVRQVSRQLSQSLQDFRNRLSERTLETLGVPLQTTEMDLPTHAPGSPDIRVGKIFDRNWELLSWLMPMPLLRCAVLKHYRRKVAELVFTNLSRLTSQWEGAIGASLVALETTSARRLDALVGSIDKLIASAGRQAPQIYEEMQRVEELRRRIHSGGES
jgi:GTP-binding protein EngB required for normal cell division